MDKQHLAAEFARVKAAYDRRGSLMRTKTITLDEYDDAYATFARFLWDRRDDIAIALTEWAQQDEQRNAVIHDAQQKLHAFIGSVESLERLIWRLKESHD